MAKTSRRPKKQNVSATKRLSKIFKQYDLSQSWAGLFLGAVVVIVLGFLVANFLTRNSNQVGQIADGIKTNVESQMTNETPQRTYKVKGGDSLSAIAERTYGNQAMWNVLAVKNKIVFPNLIYADTTLEVPPKAEADIIIKDLNATSYQVQEGDTLFVIAQKVYADGWKWPVLAKANHVGYLPNGNPLIFAGNTLIIPR